MPGETRRTVPSVGPVSDAAAPVPSPLGQLGRYELLSLLAKGGMGEVFLARARGLGGFEKLVVVKRNLPGLDPAHQPLLAEARLAATLQHTNIVQVHDVEQADGTMFIAMEFLHGQDVRNILKRAIRALEDGARLPLDHASAIAIAVCAGLDYAHDKRDGDGTPLEIVHRDVSPSNVLVTYDGGVKLIDFGIAKATTLPSETQLGTVKGKPGYMSPEQCLGEPLDRRSDLFCVGILLYEMTTGRRAFRAENEFKMYKAIAEVDPPRPSSIDAAYPPNLEAIVMRALHKERRQRYPSARALQADLEALATELRLDVSQYALARYMATLFHDELAAWHEAQRTGQSLVQYVVARATTSIPALLAPGPSQQVTTFAAPAPPRRSRRWVLGAAVIAVLAIVLVFVARAVVTDRPAARSEAAATVPPPLPPPASAIVPDAGVAGLASTAPDAGSGNPTPTASDAGVAATVPDAGTAKPPRPRTRDRARVEHPPPRTPDRPPVDAGPGIDDPIP